MVPNDGGGALARSQRAQRGKGSGDPVPSESLVAVPEWNRSRDGSASNMLHLEHSESWCLASHLWGAGTSGKLSGFWFSGS